MLHRPPNLHKPSTKQQVLRRYHISERDDYKKYNKLCGHITKLVAQLRQLNDKDATRIELTDKLLDKCVVQW